ncbi:MAG: CehA/McbA family metallohydrolase [Deltaproteobacteria bacterium]|nr:CehA/McbA family metallohydrolase [Deltaproteobacteria bacterium]
MGTRRIVLFVAWALGCGSDGGDAPLSDAGQDAEADSGAGADAGGGGIDAAVPPDCPTGPDGADTTEVLADGQVRAGRVADVAALIGGPSADGRVGDFKIYGSRAAFIVQSERVGDNYATGGGALIDADLARAPGEPGADAIDEFVTTPGIVAFTASCVGVVEDGSSGEALVRAVGTDANIGIINGLGFQVTYPVGLIIVNDYRLAADSSSLEVTTRVVNPTALLLPMDLGDFLLLSDDAMDPFDMESGFGRMTFRSPIIGSAGEASHFAVGVFPAEGDLDANYLGIGQFLADGPGGDISIFIYRMGSATLAQNEEASYTRYVAVGHDVDDIVRERQRIVPGAGEGLVRISGVVREEKSKEPVAGARVHVTSATSYASAAMTDEDGRYEAVVPAGTYSVVATGATIGQDVIVPNQAPPDPPFAAGRHRGPAVEVDATAGDVTQDLGIGPAVPIDLTLRDGDGEPVAGKVTFEFADGVDPTPPDPKLGERNPYGFASNVFWTSDGRITGFVAPGSYRVVATAGFDYELDARDAELAGPEPYAAEFTLERAIDRTGYASLDAHLHAAPSIHGEVTLEERLVTNLAEGLDSMAASDHDRVVDYGPAVARTGLGDRIVIMPSEEISTFLNGHFNPYPVILRPELPDNGRIDWWDGMTVDEMFREAIDDMGAIVMQINHGGGNSRGAYFNDAGYDPVTGEVAHPDRWSDLFNTIEIVNGKGDGNWEPEVEIFYGLVNHGKRVGITGVSDSHHRIPEAGYGRTYVRLDDEVPTPESVAIAVRDGHTVVSGGPLVLLRAGEDASVGEGDTIELDAPGTVHLSIRVEAPAWIPVETLTLVQEGVPIEEIEVEGGAPVWFDETRDVPVDRDTWFVVRVDGTSDLGPAYPGAIPFAITSPVYVSVAE